MSGQNGQPQGGAARPPHVAQAPGGAMGTAANPHNMMFRPNPNQGYMMPPQMMQAQHMPQNWQRQQGTFYAGQPQQRMPYPQVQMPMFPLQANNPTVSYTQPATGSTPGGPQAGRPSVPASTGTAQSQQAPPKKKRSMAIKIMNPETNEEVKVQSPPPKEKPKAGPPAVAAPAPAPAPAPAAATDTTAPAPEEAPGTPGQRKKKIIAITAPKDSSRPAPSTNGEPVPEAKQEKPAQTDASQTDARDTSTTPAAPAAAAAPAEEPKTDNSAPSSATADATTASTTAAAPALDTKRTEPADGGDGPDSSPAVSATATVETTSASESAKPTLEYAEGQWSPGNTSGTKSYGVEFMEKFKAACKEFSTHAHFANQPKLDKSLVPRAPEQETLRRKSGAPSSDMFAQGMAGVPSGGLGSGMRSGSQGRLPSRGPPRARDGRDHRMDHGMRGNHGPRGGSMSGGPRTITLPKREQVTLHKDENRWKPTTAKGDKPEDPLKPCKAILNKLTLEKFAALSKGLVDLLLADLHGLLQGFTGMLFDKAVDEPFFSVVYAKLCRALSDQIKDDTVKFKHILLSQCQRHFESASAADAAAALKRKPKSKEEIKAEEDKVAAMGNAERKAYEKKAREEEREGNLKLAKTKRHVLGNITFIGELYKQDMVPDKILTYCIDHLFNHAVDDATEANLEQLCKLLDTAGGKLERHMIRDKKKKKSDAKEAAEKWEEYFKKLKDLAGKKSINSRIRFAIQDVLDLRSRSWQARNASAGPKTIAEIHAAAAQEQATIEKNNAGSRGAPPGRNSRGRDGGRGLMGGYGSGGSGNNSRSGSGDQWKVVDSRKEKVDLSKLTGSKGLGSLGKLGGGGGGLKLGGNLGGLKLGGIGAGGWGNKSSSPSGEVSGDGRYIKKNKFGVLGAGAGAGAGADLKPRGSPLLQRAKERAGGSPASALSPPPEPACKYSDEELELKITGCLKEYLSIRSLEEVQLSLKEWGAIESVHKKFMTTAFNMAVEGKDGDRKALQTLFKQIVGKDIKGSTFHGFTVSFFEFVPDLMIDAPKAHENIAMLIAGGIDADPMAASIIRKLTEPEILEMMYGDMALKMALAICKEVMLLQDKERMVSMFTSLKMSLSQLLSPPDNERVADVADRFGLSSLVGVGPEASGTAPVSSSGSSLSKVEELIGSGATSDAIVEYINGAAPLEQQKTPAFVHSLNTALMSGITGKTTCPSVGTVTDPTKEACAAEEQLVKDVYSPIMMRICDTDESLQLHVLCSIQTFAHEKGQPPRLVGRWFDYMYDLDVVVEPVFMTYKDDSTISKKAPYEGKNTALTTANAIYIRLSQDEEEDTEN